MINFFKSLFLWSTKQLLLTLLLTLGFVPPGHGGERFKKSTVIDFDGALVEGKSRKPYSAYLTQQKESAFGELHQWQPDLDKRLLDTQTRLDRLK